MENWTYLLELLEYYTLIKRREYCDGCEAFHGSQKHHQICMSSINRIFYYKQALKFMLYQNIITHQEYLKLELWVKQNGATDAR